MTKVDRPDKGDQGLFEEEPKSPGVPEGLRAVSNSDKLNFPLLIYVSGVGSKVYNSVGRETPTPGDDSS